ncbi:MAG TPA: FAD-dependent monooxygenase [Acidimicrobiia bacterium]|nr:FAD-dependent monooxygenase [Acidimicrobiia bacterium]
MSDVADVVVVGGGIGGASLGCALAREGLGVTVLEATTEFEDRVRGESMHAWGVKEARDLGVEDVMLAAGAHVAPLWKQYSEAGDEPGEIPVGMMVPDISGTLNLRHPVACQALADAATDAGATVVRGARDVKLANGGSPTVKYASNGISHEIRTSLVVGADGRASTVRRQVGITLERQPPISYIAGLLIDGLDDVPNDHDVLADAGDLFFVLFHQGGGRARVYVVPGVSGRHRFSGREGTERFLTACRQAAYPWSDQVAAGTPAGPCATYPGDDTWTEAPFADGVVLIGDAAGHNDPIIGQGLSIAMRDARIVRDLVLDRARDAAGFTPYGTERLTRMERLRFIADVLAVTQAEDADNRSARRAYVGEKMAAMDPEIFGLLVGAFAAPENVPPELFDPGLLDRIRAA